jgi:hypothetical protein
LLLGGDDRKSVEQKNRHRPWPRTGRANMTDKTTPGEVRPVTGEEYLESLCDGRKI